MNQRPNPDAILEKITLEERRSQRGKLKIFFGGCAGVGKTYAMLSAAHQRLAEGIVVVAGVVETHGRSDTMKLLEGIPQIPQKDITHKGITVKEFDLDAALKRKPTIILMDELAHTNATGSRHLKRWNDVEELLAAGIDVYTTLNVQHLESLSDLVAGTTGVWVKETVPDSFFDSADDIVLVDINADELLKRLGEGKVYIGEQARAKAAENFFKKSNIIALRELALRRTTERVDAQMDAYKFREGIQNILPVSDKILVCIGSDHLSEKLIRTAKRIAASLKAHWKAIYIENARHYRLNEEARKQVQSNLKMAERLGGKIVNLQGANAVDEIIEFARTNNITKIIVGKPERSRFKELIFGTFADKIIRKSGYIDIYIVTGERSQKNQIKTKSDLVEFKPKLYLQAVAIITICTILGVAFHGIIKPADQMLIYLIGNIIASSILGRGASFLYALLSAACLNFFFIEPLYTLEIYDRSYWLTLIVMLGTSIVINFYASKLRLQAFFARKRENETKMLYDFTKEIAITRGRQSIAEAAEKQIKQATGFDISVFLADESGHLQAMLKPHHYIDEIKENSLMGWCFDNAKPSGIGTDTMPSAQTLYLPLVTADAKIGVLGIIPPNEENKKLSTEQFSLLETFASLLASAIERANAAEVAENLKVDVESEKLRNVLLSSVSHDLRTPLASISGAASSALMLSEKLPSEVVGLLNSIHGQAGRLAKLVTNLLDATSLESGAIRLNKQPYFIQEVIGSALTRIVDSKENRIINTHISPNLPLIEIDGLLIEQVLVNLLDNAIRYTKSEGTINIFAEKDADILRIRVADNGVGLPEGEEEKIFDKFYTHGHSTEGNAGLGLAICRGIINAHNGMIFAKNNKNGGASFTFTLPGIV